MVVAGKHVRILLIVVEWLKSNHLTAKKYMSAPLPKSTKYSCPIGEKWWADETQKWVLLETCRRREVSGGDTATACKKYGTEDKAARAQRSECAHMGMCQNEPLAQNPLVDIFRPIRN